MLAFKLAAMVDMETATLFWRCILEPNETKAYEMLPAVCDGLLRNIDVLPDPKSRQVIGEGLEWARDHPESIQIHVDRRTARQGHFPNLVAFSNLLDGLDKHSRDRGLKVARIVHDRQSEFEQTLAAWHEMFSNASPEEIKWAGETYSFQKLPGSEFEVCADEDSPGIQVADVVLWLYAQFRKGRLNSNGCLEVVQYVLSHGWESDFSFAGVERMYVERFGPILATPLSPERAAAAAAMLAEAEKARQESMARYERDGITPFMRPAHKEDAQLATAEEQSWERTRLLPQERSKGPTA